MKPVSRNIRPSQPSLSARLADVHHAITSCERCPRLRQYCRQIAQVKKRAHRQETYWAHPVPGFGDPAARLLIVGLAPAAHGANRTGRVFTGDGNGGSGALPTTSQSPKRSSPAWTTSKQSWRSCRTCEWSWRSADRLRRLLAAAAPARRRRLATPLVCARRPRRHGTSATDAHRLLSPEPAEHEYREAHASNDGGGVRAGATGSNSHVEADL
jgi:uracil DNA glycosylase superfamily protein